MPVTVERARRIQFGKQTTFDTAVPATFRYSGDLDWKEEIDYYEPDYPQGVRGQTIGQLVITRNGFTGTFNAEATFEESNLFFAAALKGGVVAVGAGTDKTWTYTPPPTGDPAPSYISAEYSLNDFTTDYGRKVSNILVDKISYKFTINAPATMSVSLFGGKVTAAAPTAALTVLPSREAIASNSLKIYADSAFAGLGTTQFVGNVISCDIDLMGGLRGDYTLQGRAGLDYAQYLFGDIGIMAKVTLEYNAQANTEFTNWRTGVARYMRFIATGTVVGSAVKTLKIDCAMELVAQSTIGKANGNDIAVFTYKGKYSSTAAYIFSAVLINGQATLT